MTRKHKRPKRHDAVVRALAILRDHGPMTRKQWASLAETDFKVIYRAVTAGEKFGFVYQDGRAPKLPNTPGSPAILCHFGRRPFS